MKKKYLIGLAISVFVLTCNQVFIQYWLQQKKDDAEEINIAGRQRMLSQRINLEMYKIYHEHTNTAVLKVLEEQWIKAHNALLYGDSDLELTGVTDKESKALLADLTPRITEISGYIDKQAYLNEDRLISISGKLNEFLLNMDKAVKTLEESSNRKLNFIIVIEIILALVSMLVIVGEVLFIYRPISKRLEKQLVIIQTSEAELLDRNDKLKRIAQIQSHKLRRPLANILGLVHLIKFDDRNEFNDMYLDKLQKSAEELDETIATIVNHTKTIDEDDILEL